MQVLSRKIVGAPYPLCQCGRNMAAVSVGSWSNNTTARVYFVWVIIVPLCWVGNGTNSRWSAQILLGEFGWCGEERGRARKCRPLCCVMIVSRTLIVLYIFRPWGSHRIRECRSDTKDDCTLNQAISPKFSRTDLVFRPGCRVVKMTTPENFSWTWLRSSCFSLV